MTAGTQHHPRERTHGHGMADDLAVMEATVGRRRALAWFAGAGTAALAARGARAALIGTAPVAPGHPACAADPAETTGPFPADGTNTASGSTSNVLASTGVVRSDIRSSFIGTNTVATGVPMSITLTLVDVDASCAPLAGHALYLWQCDRNGDYSLYGAAPESYLRGVQVSDRHGQVTFTTIFPACYSGRWPHLHFEVFANLAHALNGRDAMLASQLAMPAGLCTAVFADTTTYPGSGANFAQLSLANDMVFGDGTPAQLAQQTPVFTGSPAAGLAATALIGIAR